jgi:hypothetical protein
MNSLSRRSEALVFPGRGVLLGLLLSAWLSSSAWCSSDGVWSLTPGFESAPRARSAVVYDAANQRAVVFGGQRGSERLNDVRVLPLEGAPGWAQLLPAGTPPTPRSDAAAIYDPQRQRMIVFGGSDGALQNEVWALSLDSNPAWTLLTPTGTPPAPRRGALAIYDAWNDRLIVFGGYDGSAARNDVWALSLGASPAWTALAPTGTAPSVREGASGVYDPLVRRLVMFGGYNAATNTYLAQTWTLSLTGTPTWKKIFAPGAEPTARAFGSAIVDPVHSMMVVVGGYNGQQSFSETSVLMLYTNPVWQAWGPGPASLARRHAAGAVYDPLQGRVILFGGAVDHWEFPLSDVWSLPLSSPTAWTRVLPADEPPFPLPRRDFCTAVANDQLIVFGGGSAGAYLDDAYVRPMSGGPWTSLADAGVRPPGRSGAQMLYDPPGNRLLVFGGGTDTDHLSDLWEYSFGSSAWGLLASHDGLSSVTGAVYDPVRHRAVMLDSYTAGSMYTVAMNLDDYGMSVIINPQPSNSIPSNRFSYSLIYQPSRDRVVMFGGAYGPNKFNQVWFLPLSGPAIWYQEAIQGVPPSARWAHTAVYDATRDRMVVIGGWDGSAALNDAWELTLGTQPTWRQLNPSGALPRSRDAAGAVYDATREKIVLFGGFDPGAPEFLNDLGSLSFGGTVSVEAPQVSRLSLAGARPNPAARAFSIAFSLEDASPARLELFDVAGRRVFAREVGSLGAGAHEVSVGEGRALAGGLYFVRLGQRGRLLTSRVVVAH